MDFVRVGEPRSRTGAWESQRGYASPCRASPRLEAAKSPTNCANQHDDTVSALASSGCRWFCRLDLDTRASTESKRVHFGYGLNYLIDTENAVIVDANVEARTLRAFCSGTAQHK